MVRSLNVENDFTMSDTFTGTGRDSTIGNGGNMLLYGGTLSVDNNGRIEAGGNSTTDGTNIDINVFNVNNSECGLTSLYICFQNRFSFESDINASLKSMLSKSILDKIKLLLNAPNVNEKSLYKQNTVLHFGVCLFADRDYSIDDTFFNIQKEKLRLILSFEG